MFNTGAFIDSSVAGWLGRDGKGAEWHFSDKGTLSFLLAASSLLLLLLLFAPGLTNSDVLLSSRIRSKAARYHHSPPSFPRIDINSLMSRSDNIIHYAFLDLRYSDIQV